MALGADTRLGLSITAPSAFSLQKTQGVSSWLNLTPLFSVGLAINVTVFPAIVNSADLPRVLLIYFLRAFEEP